jgi:hypothetical protein
MKHGGSARSDASGLLATDAVAHSPAEGLRPIVR